MITMKKTVEVQETQSQCTIHIENQTNQVKSTLDKLIKPSHHITEEKKNSFMKSSTSEDHSSPEKCMHNKNIKPAKPH